MVVDTSAIVAALSGEAGADHLLDALASSPDTSISSGTLLDARIVLMARYGEEGLRALDLLLHAADVSIVPVSRDQVDVATEGFRRYGKGRHAAGLNHGGLFAYGLASLRAEPLLFVGDDFAETDVPSALSAS